jgi:regulator of CtrA degradation
MREPTDLTATIVEELYCEALILADDVRAAFDLTTPRDVGKTDLVRIALSTEGLKTTTRVMHVLAWLLNQRAYFRGEMTEYQLTQHGRLPPDRPSEPSQLELLEVPTQLLILETQLMHARVARLDKAWREGPHMRSEGLNDIRARLESALRRL